MDQSILTWLLAFLLTVSKCRTIQKKCVSTYFYSLCLFFSSCASFAYWYSVWSVSVFLSHLFCSPRTHDNGCYKKGPYCSPCSGFDNDNDTDTRNISTNTLWYVDVWRLFFCGAPGQDMTVLDSRVYTWQEDLRWSGWFGVYWTDMNRMNCSAFGTLYSGLFRYSECISNGVFSRNSQTSIIDPSIFFGTSLRNCGSWGDDLLFMESQVLFPPKCAVNPLDTPVGNPSWGWHEHQMHLRRSLRLAWSSRILFLFKNSIFQSWWCLMYVPRPSKRIKIQPPGLFLVVKGHKFHTLEEDSGNCIRLDDCGWIFLFHNCSWIHRRARQIYPIYPILECI